MPNWKKLITSGSAASLSSITTSGDITIPATNKIYLDGGGNTYITEEVADQITLRAGGGNYFKVGTANGIIINDPGADLDTRIEGNTDQNLLFVDAGEDRVGVGTNSPDSKLHIYEGTGTTASSTGTSLFTLTNYVGADLNQQKTFIDFTLLDDNANETPQVRVGAEVGQNGDADSQEKEGSGAFVVYTNNADTTSGDAGASLAERMRVDYQGFVGIGTTSPTYELDVEGNIGMNAILYHNGDDNTYLKFDTDRVRMSAGGETLLDLYEDGTQDYVKLGDGGDVDINLNDDMFIEGSSGNVGIGATTLDDGNLQIGDANSAFNIAIAGPRTKFGYDGSNAIVQGGTAKGIAFCVNNTTLGSGEAMKIDSSGNVGIGVSSPDSFVHISASVGSSTASLHVEGSGSEVFAVDGTNGRLFTVTDELSGSLFSANTIAGLPVIEAFSDYKVTLGPYSSQTTVDSSGNLSVSGEIRATGDVIAYYSSDERFKDNIQPIQDSLYKISKIGGYEYDWNDKQSTYEGHDVGVIAQEIHKVLPEVVTEREDGYLAVKYEKVVPLLIESIKELKQEVDDIKKNCKCLSDGNEL